MEKYIVKEGDTLLSIAEAFGVRLIDLITQNKLEDIYVLIPGTELVIPVDMPLGFTSYIVKKGDSLYAISRSLGNITPNQLAEVNGLEINEYIYPGQRLIVPKPGVKVYITKNGDTIKTVAEAIGTSDTSLIVYNPNVYLLPEQLIAYELPNNSINSQN